uniref:serine/threonine-protein kinase n=1 Tax=Zhongshania sp. TaxID=1971902 RepID=UPI0035662210
MPSPPEARQLFGIDEGASLDAIDQAYYSKRAELQKKQKSAPTPALAAKFATVLAKLDDHYAALVQSPVMTNSTTSATSASSLSQTKLDDLPGVAPSDINRLSFAAGHVLAGRYTIAELIGQGGMGAVYRAHDKNRDEDIAIKILLPSLTNNERALTRFMDEARISSKLSHPNIVNVYDVQNDGDLYFLTMELLEGQGVNQLLETRESLQQPFSEKELLDIVGQLLPALSYAHEHTVHRDIKPENIWLTKDGHYKLMDFGIAQLQSTSRRTQTGTAMGTAYYMAPEQIKGSKHLDARADLYAVGILLYTLATGDVPAGLIKPLQKKRPDLNHGFCQAVMQCLEPQPDERPADAVQLLTALQTTAKARRGMPKQGNSKQAKSVAGLNAGPNKRVVATLVLLLFIGLGAIAGTGVWKDWIPASKAEIAREKAAVAKLQGELKVIKQRLDTARRNLDSEVRDAERNNNKGLAALNYWQRLSEAGIFNGNQIPSLEGELAVGETLLREGRYAEAQNTLSKVRDGYKTLQKEFNAAEKLFAAETSAAQAKAAWLKRKK